MLKMNFDMNIMQNMLQFIINFILNRAKNIYFEFLNINNETFHRTKFIKS
jgi:hypothetical protein